MSTCPTCRGTGSQREAQVLTLCPSCQGAGCDHHTSQVKGDHCALCEQDDVCRGCWRINALARSREPIPAERIEDDLELDEPLDHNDKKLGSIHP